MNKNDKLVRCLLLFKDIKEKINRSTSRGVTLNEEKRTTKQKKRGVSKWNKWHYSVRYQKNKERSNGTINFMILTELNLQTGRRKRKILIKHFNSIRADE